MVAGENGLCGQIAPPHVELETNRDPGCARHRSPKTEARTAREGEQSPDHAVVLLALLRVAVVR